MSQEDVQGPFNQRAQSLQPPNPAQHDNSYADPESIHIEMGAGSMFNNDLDASRAADGSPRQQLIKYDDNFDQSNDTKKITVGGLEGSQLNPRKSLTMSKSQMQKSQSGFDIGTRTAVGSFFSSIRHKKEGETQNFYDSEKMNGKEFVKKLIQQQEDRYHKKFAFERGQYHQCIPNPRKEKQMITVQLITRSLEGYGHEPPEDQNTDQMFDGDQGKQMPRIYNDQQHYQRYNLQPPGQDLNEQDDNGEGEGEGNENADDDDAPDKEDGLTDRTANGTSLYGEINPELYKPNKLADEEVIDPISGVVPYHYANIGKSKSQQLAINSCMDAKELAVIAFWDLDPMDDTFKCIRFFLLPNPMKRNIIDTEGTSLDQVLYESTHTKEVFFFFKGYEMGAGEDIEEVALEHKLQIGFLRLEINDEQLKTIGEARHFKFHINNIVTIPKANILATQLTYLDRTSVTDQKQLPNPTMIATVSQKVVPGTPNNMVKGKIGASLLNKVEVASKGVGRTLVFTAFLREEFHSKEDIEEDRPNTIENCWYPTIFFYDLDENKVVWEIFGAEQFISIDPRHRVTVLTNEIWTEITKDEYEQKIEKEEDFCRHWDYANWIWKTSYNALFSPNEIADRANKAPSVPTQNSYRLDFGNNKKLEITESVKVVEAYLHNMEKRVTLVYKGLGSFTFDLRTAKQLIEPGDWGGKFEKRKFHATMRLNLLNNQIEGEGKDEDNKNVSVAVKLNRKNNYSWQGQYETEDELVPIFIDDLDMNLNDGTMTGHSQEQDPSSADFVQIDGTIGPRRTKNQTQIAKFRLTDCNGEKSFEGTINASTSKISGSWTDSDGKKYSFELKLAENVDADLSLKFENEPEINEQIQVDFVRKEVVKMPGFEKNFKLYAIGAVDQAQLCYFIPQVDVVFFMNKQDAYIQAKLTAIDEGDYTNNGKGVAYTTLVLYKVSDVPKVDKKKEAASGNKKKKIGEPKARQYINFLLNQSFLKTQENKEWQLWCVNQPCISSDNRFFSSVIYEEMGTDELRLNFVTSTINQNKEDDIEDLDFPQSPVDQTWIVDYPLLAYKTFTPMNKEIAIVHMALNMPQRIIHLGEWEFVCFVNHTQMIEQRLFEKSKETNCDIMFLVRRQGKIRLMSFKSNPWLKFDEPASDVDPDVYKQAIFMFSGHLSFLPSLDAHGNKIFNYDQAYIQKYSRRFNNDKIQNAQLITKTYGGAQYYAMIIQFNDCIMQASFNSQIFISKCEPEQMVRRHLIRGYSENIYYARTDGSSNKIYQLSFHVSKPNQIDSNEIYQLAGSEIVAFEPDGENIQDDYNNEVVTQSFYIMDDQQKIYHLVNEGDLDFEIKNLIDFSQHNKRAELIELMLNEWAHVHISERTITFFDRTYNLNSLINVELQIPQAFFGEEKRQNNAIEDDDDNDDDDEDDDRQVEEEEQDWTIQNVQNMSMTTNMVAQCQRNHKEFCFLMKPAPGSRKINIFGFQQIHEVKQMLFVSNGHILIKFRDVNNKPGKAVTLLSNGCMVEQLPRIQKYLDTNSSVVGESQITRGVKIVLFQQFYGENEEKSRLVALEFNKHGLAEVVGIFDEYKEKMLLEYASYLEVQKKLMENFNESSKEHSELAKQTSMSLNGVMANVVVNKHIEGLKKKETQSKIKYAKEFFVTEKGEIIKMAAIVSDNPQVIAELEKDKRIESKDNKRPTFKSGTNADTFISVFNMENTKLEDSDSVKCQYKVVVFHCLNPDHQNAMVKSTQFSVVGDFLCYRLKSRRIIWCTKLKKDGQEFIPVNNFSGNQDEQSGQYNLLYTKFTSVCISLADMVAREDMDHIQLTEVPKAFFSTIEQRDGFKLKFFDNLLQVTIRSHGMIFNLDTNPIEEVDSIEDIDQLQKTDALVNTGFIMSASQDDYWHEEKFLRRIQVFTNEYVNLLFEKKQDRYADGTREHYISGMLFRTFAEVDLQQLYIIFKKIESRQRLDDIDIESVLSTYEGHTIFSIFADQINVFEKILAQLDDMEFPEEDNFDGQDCENSILRRLYRVMNLPVTDLLKLKIVDGDRTSEAEKFAAAEEEASNANSIVKSGRWVKSKLGLATNQIETGHAGFKSILKKSLHFESARFRESLMEIAMLCQENSINNFIDNLADIRILFTSMSPAVVEFFQNGFNETRFTKRIRNLDWTMGKPMKVIGKMGSVMTEKEANWIVTNGKPGSQSEKVQNRQVDAKVLMIDWIYASQGGLDQVGFRELVIELSRAPHESLFGTEFVQILVESFWDRYFKAILLRCFVPFLVYFFATNYYLQQYALEGIPEDARATFSLEFVLRWLILLSLLYFMFFELVQILRDRFEYFTDIYNYFDMAQYTINVYLILQTVNHDNKASQDFDYTTRALATLTIFLMWFKVLYWMRLFSATSFYIKLIRETLYDILSFLILFIFALAMFGSCVMMMNEGRGDSPIVTDVFGQRYVDVIFNQYMLSLGEFEVDNFEGDGKDTIIWIIFILTTFITQITFLNMLIAIMGDTFSRVTESKAQSGLREKIAILSDFVIIVKRESVARGNLSRFLFAIQPKDQASDEGNAWEGTVTQLNKSMKKELTILENKFSKRISNLSSEITTLGGKTDGLSRELDEVKGSCQRLPKMEDIEKSLKRIIQEELRRSRGVVAQDSILDEEGHVSAAKTSEVLAQAADKKTGGGFGLGGFFGKQ